jgi:hypothetical protein
MKLNLIQSKQFLPTLKVKARISTPSQRPLTNLIPIPIRLYITSSKWLVISVPSQRSGVKLDTSVAAIKGIANLAAISGSTRIRRLQQCTSFLRLWLLGKLVLWTGTQL